MEKGKLKGMFVSGNMPAGAEYKEALKDVLQAFPYFQIAQVLFAKQMYDTHEPEASSRIKLASVYAPDRKAMYILFKRPFDKVDEKKPLAASVDTAKPQEKAEVKYNFVYSSTSVEKAEVTHSQANKEAETASLSETFIREEPGIKPLIQTTLEEKEKVAAVVTPKVEEKKPEPLKVPPFISVDTPKEKAQPVETKQTETKKPETPTPPKKPYISPTIEKKRSLYKKPEPTVVKPLVTVKPPVETKPPVVEKKPEEKKPEPIAASAKKPYTPPALEKKIVEKKPEPSIAKPLVTIKPPAETKPPSVEKKIEEKKPEPPIVKPIVTAKPPVIEKKKPEPIAASGRKPYTPPTIVWKRSLYKKKEEDKKPEQPIVQAPIIVKPTVEKIIPEVVIEVKKPEPEKEIIVEPIAHVEVAVPVIEEKKVEPEKEIIAKPIAHLEIAVPVIEDSKPEPEKEIITEAVTPIEIELPVTEEEKIETITPSFTEEKPTVIEAPIVDTTLKHSFTSWLKVLPEIGDEKQPEVKPLDPALASGLIDKFLQKESTISRPKAEFFSPVKAAKMSITEDDTIVSETLARIYFEQGSLPKALKAYQTLLLLFSEKKNIFAPRIEEIKALIRENTK